VREDAEGRLVPEESVYRVSLAPRAPVPAPEQVRRGTVYVEGEARSLLDRAWRAVAAVLIRESGF
jgi:putative peptide zinc metalloprotease protein